MNKVLVFFADGFEEIEGLTVIDILKRAEIPVEMVSITGSKSVTGSHGISILTDAVFDEADFDNAHMLVLPGGQPGTTNLEACAPLMEKLDSFKKAIDSGDNKYLAAICAAPSIFAHRGYLKDRKACSHPSMESHLSEAGADLKKEPVCNDGNIITSRGMGTAIIFALKITAVLKDGETADRISTAIVNQ